MVYIPYREIRKITKRIAIECSNLKNGNYIAEKESFKVQDELYPENWLRAVICSVIISN